MATVTEVKSIADILVIDPFASTPDEVKVEPYGFDSRIGWDTHMVSLKKGGVLGFTNGPLTK